MFYKSIVSEIKDATSFKETPKYKLINIDKNSKNTKVVVEIVSENIEIIFNLEDLIKDDKLKYFSSIDVVSIARSWNKTHHNELKKSQDKKLTINTLTQLFIFLYII